MAPSFRAGQLATAAILLLLLVAAAAAGWWAGRATLSPTVADEETAGAAPAVWAQAQEGSVGRALPLSTTLRQPAVAVAQNSLAGVVTSVSPGTVKSGDAVYVVGDTPVRVVQSSTPFWRDLALSLRGDDVAAVQRHLISAGLLKGSADGTFGTSTETAVKAWQRQQGQPQTGRIALGELIAVKDLPAVVQLGDAIVVGRAVSGGEDNVLAPTGSREFVLTVTQEQARLIPAEATVEVTFDSHVWSAVIAGSQQQDSGLTDFTLASPGDGEICGKDCAVLPNDPQVHLRSRVIVVPEVSGTTVPAAAVRTRADGTAYVVTDSGPTDVTVSGSGQGVAVVEGIDAQTRVQVTGESQDGTASNPVPTTSPTPESG